MKDTIFQANKNAATNNDAADFIRKEINLALQHFNLATDPNAGDKQMLLNMTALHLEDAMGRVKRMLNKKKIKIV